MQIKKINSFNIFLIVITLIEIFFAYQQINHETETFAQNTEFLLLNNPLGMIIFIVLLLPILFIAWLAEHRKNSDSIFLLLQYLILLNSLFNMNIFIGTNFFLSSNLIHLYTLDVLQLILSITIIVSIIFKQKIEIYLKHWWNNGLANKKT